MELTFCSVEILNFLQRKFLTARNITHENTPIEEYENEKEIALQEAYKITQEEHEKVVTVGGLHIIGTERHESRRIDNQLRGRAGGQGDPGQQDFSFPLKITL